MRLKYYILGNGSNVILDDNYFDGVIIKLNKLNKISINDNFVKEAEVLLSQSLQKIYQQSQLQAFYLPKIFIRVRNPLQNGNSTGSSMTKHRQKICVFVLILPR